LTERQIDHLTYYMLSLRRSNFPEAFWPQDRIRAERFGEREFTIDGATLYGTFCAACHGPQGQGLRYPGMTPFPAIGNPDFVAVAGDDSGVVTALKKIAGVTQVKALKGGQFDVETAPGKDLRPEIAKAVIKGDWDLLEMRRDKLSLEEIFIKLTKEQ